MRTAKHVALCGHPKSGKSEFAQMLEDEFGGVIVDDGLMLRNALPILTGVDPKDPFSQEGKAKLVTVGDRTETVRQGLGELGKYLEDRYGPYIMPIRAMEMAVEQHPDAPFYIYPSCRKVQGRAYKMRGGVVIQIDRPGTGPSGNDFDLFDESLVDITIPNDGSLDDLREWIHQLPNLIDARYS